MGLQQDNARLTAEVGRLTGYADGVAAERDALRLALEELQKNHESLVRQAGELNQIASDAERRNNELSYQVPQLVAQNKALLEQNTSLIACNEQAVAGLCDLAAAVRKLSKK